MGPALPRQTPQQTQDTFQPSLPIQMPQQTQDNFPPRLPIQKSQQTLNFPTFDSVPSVDNKPQTSDTFTTDFEVEDFGTVDLASEKLRFQTNSPQNQQNRFGPNEIAQLTRVQTSHPSSLQAILNTSPPPSLQEVQDTVLQTAPF